MHSTIRKRRVIWLFILVTATLKGYGQSKSVFLHTLFDSLGKSGGFNGCVLVADSGKIIFENSYGIADFEHKIPMNVNTGFELASVSKQFTAMAIMQLHNQGKLNYQDTITKYLPELPYKHVTISDLIHHASGITDCLGWTELQMGGPRRTFTNKEIESQLPILAPKTEFEPGTYFSYSNTNYLLLANIVSKISGVSFPEYMNTHIFQKAGMFHTFIPQSNYTKATPGSYAHNYLWDPITGEYQNFSSLAPIDYCYYMGGISGPAGIQSTVGDLFKWTQALNMHLLVPDSIFQAAMRPAVTKDGKDTLGYDQMAYTFGWILVDRDGKESFLWHNGGFGGYRSSIVYYPRINRTVVLLQNTDQTISPEALMGSINQIMTGSTVSYRQCPDKIHSATTIRHSN